MAASPPNPDLLQKIHALLGSTLLITMTDGRTARGKFLCLDRLGNIILEEVVERRQITYRCSCRSGDTGDEQPSEGEGELYKWDTERLLSQAVIPGVRLAKVEIARDEYEKRMGGLVS